MLCYIFFCSAIYNIYKPTNLHHLLIKHNNFLGLLIFLFHIVYKFPHFHFHRLLGIHILYLVKIAQTNRSNSSLCTFLEFYENRKKQLRVIIVVVFVC